MLPSIGLFREIVCPFFDDGSCTRPFCHFKHAKKDEIEVVKTKPTYCPTPLAYQPGVIENDSEGSRKKPKLEYIPLPTLKTQMEYKPQSNHIDEESGDDPPMSPMEEEPLEVKDDKDISIITNLEEPKSELPIAGTNDQNDSQNKENVENTHADKENVTNVQQLQATEEKNKEMSETENKKPEKNSSRSSSHSSSSRHKHKKSSSHKSSQSDKHKSSSSSKRHHSSNSDSHKKRDSKERSSSHHKASKHKSSGSSKDKHRPSSSSKSKHSSSHSSSSKKSKDKDHDKEKDKKKQEKRDEPKQKSPEIEITASDIEVSSDEDAVMEQCKMIFEEYQPEQNGTPTLLEPKKTDLPAEDESGIDVSAKKRVAYDGAIKPLLQAPVRNHKLNAMQQIYNRQEALRKVIEAQKAAKVEQFPPPVKNLPPVKSRLSIAPVSNMLAFKCAKQKIEALRKARNPVPSTSSGITDSTRTTAQTTSKFYGRTAHVAKADSDARPAPPVLDPTSNKISFNLRMQYYNMMVKECLVIYDNCEDAWSRAQTEELAVQKKCSTANIYKSSALLTINKLKKEARDAGNDLINKNKTESHDVLLAGKQVKNITWSVNKKLRKDSPQVIGNFDIMPGEKAYKLVLDCIATEEQLRTYGYPRPSSNPGKAKMYTTKRLLPPGRENERYCARCSKVFKLDVYDEICVDECNYHPKSAGFRRGSADNFHYCCQLPAGSPGCMYANYHVTDYLDYDNLKGFVKTMQKDEDYVPTKRDIFAFDCEMCYTRSGFELTRITVVNFDENVVYDSFVKPDNEIIDYNTTYSGITEESLANVKTSIREVQAVLLSMFHADTILVGHSLESDMKAVKLLHDKVIDTAMLYPHKMGFPKKRALKTLCVENLKKIIQENEAGHDSAEDAVVCIQLVKHYLRNRIV